MLVEKGIAMLQVNGMYPTLLFDGESVALVDACLPGQMEALSEAIQKEGFSVGDITHILLTHQDMDHIGCVKELMEANPNIQLIAHEDEAPYLDGRKTPAKLAARMPTAPPEQRAYMEKMLEGYAQRRITFSHLAQDGETLDLCGGILVVHTPGHTPGHMCLIHLASATLITGDALNLKDGKLAGPAPEHTLDMAQATESLRRLLPHELKAAICYHGGLFEGDVTEAIREIL